jgi:hypothetical protein
VLAPRTGKADAARDLTSERLIMASTQAIAERKSNATARILRAVETFTRATGQEVRKRGNRARDPRLSHAEDLEYMADVLETVMGADFAAERRTHAELVRILSEHTGETAENEGGVDVLKRLVRERDQARRDLSSYRHAHQVEGVEVNTPPALLRPDAEPPATNAPPQGSEQSGQDRTETADQTPPKASTKAPARGGSTRAANSTADRR